MARIACSVSQRSGLRPSLRRRRRNAPIAVATTALLSFTSTLVYPQAQYRFSARAIRELQGRPFPICGKACADQAVSLGQVPRPIDKAGCPGIEVAGHLKAFHKYPNAFPSLRHFANHAKSSAPFPFTELDTLAEMHSH